VISLPSAVRAFLCTRSVDMRKSFDGLSGLVEECFRQDLLDGHLFLFVNRRRDRIKVLYFDHDGLAIWYKRLEVGGFQVPDAGDRDGIELDAAQLAMILSGIDLKTARRRQRFRPAGRAAVPTKNQENSSEKDLHNIDVRI
jgi:transposase